MSYYPKRLLNTNLYTAGNEFILESNGEPYQGRYFEDYKGNYYTGVDPSDINIQRLIKNSYLIELEDKENLYGDEVESKLNNSIEAKNYNKAKGGENTLLKYGKDPIPFTPIPTSDDYKKGQIKRYFAKRVNEKNPSIREISEFAFYSLRDRDGEYNYNIWRISLLNWKISGDIDEIRRINENSVTLANRNFNGIKQYLTNLTQFAKNARTKALYTGGDEFINKRTRLPYRGYYHIHPEFGAMVGAEHTLEKHDILLPIGKKLDETERERILEEEDRIPTRDRGRYIPPLREGRAEY